MTTLNFHHVGILLGAKAAIRHTAGNGRGAGCENSCIQVRVPGYYRGHEIQAVARASPILATEVEQG